MVFTVDVGNTNIVLGAFRKDELIFSSRVATESDKMEDQYAIEFLDILRLYGLSPEEFDGVIISSVVPPLLTVLKASLKKLFNCKVLVVSAGIKTGLNIKIDDPAILGADLVCGAVGALKKYPVPCIIIDMGTATTISAVDRNSSFLGGIIFPGVRVSLNALSSNAAQLPDINMEVSGIHPIGKNSSDSMRSGIILGTASMIDGMIDRYKEVLGDDITVIATGGLSTLIVPFCKKKIIVDEGLLTDGLYEIYKKNT